MTDGTDSPKNAGEWSAARQIAVVILGRLAVENFLTDPVIKHNLDYAVQAIAEEISGALARIPGGCDGDLDKLLSYGAAKL
jgi:hypothetical protein